MITFDIETLPSDNPEIIAKIKHAVTPPANIKKPESIMVWWQDNGDQALIDAVAKTSLDGAYGRVACISWQQDDFKTISTEAHMTEKEAILMFYNWLSMSVDSTFCGHNIVGFDLPFLKHRSMVLGIKPPSNLIRAIQAKPWDDCIKDTMLIWSSDKNKMISLDTLCLILGIECDNNDTPGNKVAEAWAADPQQVIDKCENDVRKTKLVYDRMVF